MAREMVLINESLITSCCEHNAPCFTDLCHIELKAKMSKCDVYVKYYEHIPPDGKEKSFSYVIFICIIITYWYFTSFLYKSKWVEVCNEMTEVICTIHITYIICTIPNPFIIFGFNVG